MDKLPKNNIPKAFTKAESTDGETSDFALLWEGIIKPAEIKSFEENGKPTNLVVNTPTPITNNFFIIKK